MNTEELCTAYKDCVLDIGFHVDEEDRLIKTAFDSTKNAVVPFPELSKLQIKKDKSNDVKSMDVVLPTRTQLKAPGNSNIIFHPISEVLDRAMSPTMIYLRDQMICTTMDRFNWLIVALGEIFANNEEALDFTPKQIEGLTFNSKFTKTALQTLKRLINKHQYGNVKRRTINMTVLSKTEHNGEACRRVATVSSGLYVDLKNAPAGAKIWGVDVNETQRKAILALFDYVLTGLADGEYSVASNNSVAPFFDCLTRCYVLVNKRYDSLVKTYSTIFKKGWPFNELNYNWLDLLKNLGSAKKALTTQEGNIGKEQATPKSQQKQNSLTVRTIDEGGSAPVTTETPVETPTSTGGGIYKPLTQPQPTQPQYQPYTPPQYPQSTGYGYSAPQQPQPVLINGQAYVPGPNGSLVPVHNPQQPYYQPQPNGLNR